MHNWMKLITWELGGRWRATLRISGCQGDCRVGRWNEGRFSRESAPRFPVYFENGNRIELKNKHKTRRRTRRTIRTVYENTWKKGKLSVDKTTIPSMHLVEKLNNAPEFRDIMLWRFLMGWWWWGYVIDKMAVRGVGKWRAIRFDRLSMVRDETD